MKPEKIGKFISELTQAAFKAGVSISAKNITIYDDAEAQSIRTFSFVNPSPQCGSKNPIHTTTPKKSNAAKQETGEGWVRRFIRLFRRPHLYSWDGGNGELHISVVSYSAREARELIDAEVSRRRGLPYSSHESITACDAEGWINGNYKLTIYNINTVIIRYND